MTKERIGQLATNAYFRAEAHPLYSTNWLFYTNQAHAFERLLDDGAKIFNLEPERMVQP